MSSKKRSSFIAVVLSIVTGALVSGSVFAAPVNTAFTDDNFFNCILSAYNTENSTSLTNLTNEQLATITTLDCSSRNISDVTGLELLTGLTTLNFSSNNLSTIDLAANTQLTAVNLSNNALLYTGMPEITVNGILVAAYDLRNNPALTLVDFSGDGEITVLLTEEQINDPNLVFTPNADGSGVAKLHIGDENGNNRNGATEECASVTMSDEDIESLRMLFYYYGYDVSNFNAGAVKVAFSFVNMCDGADREEMRLVFNAMGMAGYFSDEELDVLAEEFTKSYNSAKSGDSANNLFGAESIGGTVVPNTGTNTASGFSAGVAALSLGTIMTGAGVFYLTRYGIKRRKAQVTFKD